MTQFNPGDRVEFTKAALELCDPAIRLKEMRGEVIEVDSRILKIRFDDGDRAYFPKSYFKKEETTPHE